MTPMKLQFRLICCINSQDRQVYETKQHARHKDPAAVCGLPRITETVFGGCVSEHDDVAPVLDWRIALAQANSQSQYSVRGEVAPALHKLNALQHQMISTDTFETSSSMHCNIK